LPLPSELRFSTTCLPDDSHCAAIVPIARRSVAESATSIVSGQTAKMLGVQRIGQLEEGIPVHLI
jgi:hypothetical protein